MNQQTIVRVAINVPVSRLFDYLTGGHEIKPGCRVRVPFGSQSLVGVVLEISNKSELPTKKLKLVSKVLDPSPLYSATDLQLLRFTSNYYHHPIGEVATLALPALLRQGKPLIPMFKQLMVTTLGEKCDLNTLKKRAPKQGRILAELMQTKVIPFSDLDKKISGWRSPAKGLVEKSLVEISTLPEKSTKYLVDLPIQEGPPLTRDQNAALAKFRNNKGFEVSLIHGVTGSGKTEIYLNLIKNALKTKQQILVLVPEIGLTPQLLRHFQQRLGVTPAIFHSGLTDTERLCSWRSARNGEAQVLIGTRSAIFIPFSCLGLIIVDEEHDSSYKQQESLRYSARDLAILRGKQKDIPVVLGSATPSVESLMHCREKTYRLIELPKRVGKAVLPKMKLIDLAHYGRPDGLSGPAVESIKKALDHDGQVLVFLNRRGFAPTLVCSGCGHLAECAHCDSRMTVHAQTNMLKCHHCGTQRPNETQCTVCGAACNPLGHGTERLEESLRRSFPDEMVTRIDSDSTRLKGTLDKALTNATSGETKILVGTQMLSKGHHFPNLTLVVVVNADQGLFSTDFRGSERLAQSIIQVAGRAGRELRQGTVLIQTAFPANPFWHQLLTGNYCAVIESELAEREKSAWPPFSRIALLRATAIQRNDAHSFLESARTLADNAGVVGVRVLGPVNAPMERKAGRYRAQLLLQSAKRKNLHEMLLKLRHKLEGSAKARRVRWSIDVDPIELF